MRTVLSLLRNRHDWQVTLCLPLAALTVAVCCVQSAGQPPNAVVAPAGQQNAAILPGANAGVATGQAGGAANADFDSLIDLIVSTVSSETWAENGGGEAEVRPFFGGVLVDAAGTLRSRSRQTTADARKLTAARGAAPPERGSAGDARKVSALRYVSLPRLEREIARRQAKGIALEPAMLTLAGLERVRYVFVYPASGDLVLAGPAGDWQVGDQGRLVSTATGHPVVRLDDFLVVLRRGEHAADSFFGCSINPRQDALAKTQAFLAASNRPLQPGRRKAWLEELRDTVGLQDIEVFGLDAASRAAGILVEADYHMKLIGMGLAEGVEGLESYLDSIEIKPGQSAPPMSVLRWWFTLHYESIAASPVGDAFELVGQGVRVLSENELLANQGQRIHTGRSEPLNRKFAESFTSHFAELAAKYPVYGELRNIFDLAMAVALIRSEALMDRANWKPDLFLSEERLRLPQWQVARQVETVINHRIVNRRQIIAGVSGGVMVAPGDSLRELRRAGESRGAALERIDPPKNLATSTWWWDAAE